LRRNARHIAATSASLNSPGRALSGKRWVAGAPNSLIKSHFLTSELALAGGTARELDLWKPERLVLARPFGRHIGESSYARSVRKPSINSGLDQIGRQERE